MLIVIVIVVVMLTHGYFLKCTVALSREKKGSVAQSSTPGLPSQIVLMASVDTVKQHLKKQTSVAPLSSLEQNHSFKSR